MVRLLIPLVGFVFIFGGVTAAVRYYVNMQKIASVMKEAHFDGGPLDGTVQKLKTLPEEYHYGDAIYRHNGGGIYQFEDYLGTGETVQGINNW